MNIGEAGAKEVVNEVVVDIFENEFKKLALRPNPEPEKRGASGTPMSTTERSLNVDGFNVAPETTETTITVPSGESTEISILPFVMDLDGNSLEIVDGSFALSDPSAGALTLVDETVLQFDPAEGFTGDVEITYTIAEMSNDFTPTDRELTAGERAAGRETGILQSTEGRLLLSVVEPSLTTADTITVAPVQTPTGEAETYHTFSVVNTDTGKTEEIRIDGPADDDIDAYIGDIALQLEERHPTVGTFHLADVVSDGVVNIKVRTRTRPMDGFIDYNYQVQYNGYTEKAPETEEAMASSTTFNVLHNDHPNLRDNRVVEVNGQPSYINTVEFTGMNEGYWVPNIVRVPASGGGYANVTVDVDGTATVELSTDADRTFSQTVSFTYTVQGDDSTLMTETATVTFQPGNGEVISPGEAGQTNRDSVIIFADSEDQAAPVPVLANDTFTVDSSLALTIAGTSHSGLSATVDEDKNVIVTATNGFVGEGTVTYQVTDEFGNTTTGTIDVETTDLTEGEFLERAYASQVLSGLVGSTNPGLEITDQGDGTFHIQTEAADGMEAQDFVVDVDNLPSGLNLVADMVVQFALVGAVQAYEQLAGGETHFDTSNWQENDLYKAFISVGAMFGMSDGEYGDPFNGLLVEDRVFEEMADVLFGTDVGAAWVTANADESVSALSDASEDDGYDATSVDDLLAQMNAFFTSGPDALPGLVGSGEMTTQQKDILSSIFLNQVGFLSSIKGDGPDETALEGGLDALTDFAADLYQDEAVDYYANQLNSLDFKVDLSAFFDVNSPEAFQTALENGDWNALGVDDETFFEGLSAGLFELATFGLELRNATTNPDQIAGLYDEFASMWRDAPVPPTEAEVSTFIELTVDDMRARMTADPSLRSQPMAALYSSMDEVATRPGMGKFSGFSGNMKTYSNQFKTQGGSAPSGRLGPDLGGFTTILLLGTAGLSGNGFWKGPPEEIMLVSGWLSLMVTGTTATAKSLVGPAYASAISPANRSAIEAMDGVMSGDLMLDGPVITGQNGRISLQSKIVASGLTDNVDDVAGLMRKPAAQVMNGLRTTLNRAALAGSAFFAPVGAGLIGASLAIQAKNTNDTGMKVALGATSALWLTASAGFGVAGGVAVANALGATVGSVGTKIAGIAAKTANVAARLSALAFFVVGAVQGSRAQQVFTDTWDILMRSGGPDMEEGYFVREQYHDEEPYGTAGAALWGGLASVFGFPPITGFHDDRPSATIADGGLFGSGPAGPSDIRLKTDIRMIGWDTDINMPIYSWRYVDGDATRYVGFMAQELLQRADLSRAVFVFTEGPRAGYYGVHYDKLGWDFMTEEQYAGRTQSDQTKLALVQDAAT